MNRSWIIAALSVVILTRLGSAQIEPDPVVHEVCAALACADFYPSDATCGFPATGQRDKYVEGDDGDLQAGAPLSYVDNGNGTITDSVTGLVWEKKIALDDVGSSELHDADNRYPWTGACDGGGPRCGSDADCPAGGTCHATDEQGTGLTIFQWVARLNAENFAGHDDWRIPNVKELHTLVDFQIPYPGPAIDTAFDGVSCGGNCTDLADPACSCTAPSGYKSSTVADELDSGTSGVEFAQGGLDTRGHGSGHVRAVRGGL